MMRNEKRDAENNKNRVVRVCARARTYGPLSQTRSQGSKAARGRRKVYSWPPPWTSDNTGQGASLHERVLCRPLHEWFLQLQ